MKPKTHLNGSRESLPEAVARIEQRLNQLKKDLKSLSNPLKPSPENGFARFLKTIDRRQN